MLWKTRTQIEQPVSYMANYVIHQVHSESLLFYFLVQYTTKFIQYKITTATKQQMRYCDSTAEGMPLA